MNKLWLFKEEVIGPESELIRQQRVDINYRGVTAKSDMRVKNC